MTINNFYQSLFIRILELPEDFVPPKQATLADKPLIDYSDYSDGMDTDKAIDGSHSSDTSEINDNNTAYRHKEVPRYRDPVFIISSGENSPDARTKEKDYFADDDIDEVLLLENISTPADQSKPKVLEEDDDVLEVSITLNRSKRKNDSQFDDFLTPSHKKRKSSSDKDNSLVQNNPTPSFISSPVTVDTSELNSSTQSTNIKFQLPNFSTPIGKKIPFGASSTITTKSAVREVEQSVFPSIGKSNSFSVSSTITKSVANGANSNQISKSLSFTAPSATTVQSAERTILGDFTLPRVKNNSFTASSTVSKHNDSATGGSNILALDNDEKTSFPAEVFTPPPPPKPVLVDVSNLRPGMKDFNFYVKKQVVSISTIQLS